METEKRKQRAPRFFRALLWIGAGGVLFVATAAIAFYLAMKVEMISSQVEVPDLAGLPREEASARASGRGLRLEVVGERHDAGLASGRILEQDPPAGIPVRPGRKVKVFISLGGEVLSVPDVVGHAARTVQIELSRQGFAAGDEARVPERPEPAGTVIGQVPPPGTPAVPSTRIHRLVSEGPRPPRWVMPDLTGRAQGAVAGWIERSGFRRGPVRRAPAAGQAPGTVVGQLPLSGHPIAARDVIELTVAE